MKYDAANKEWRFTPGKKVRAIKKFESWTVGDIKVGDIFTVDDSGQYTVERPRWNLGNEKIGGLFRYHITKSHLPKWW